MWLMFQLSNENRMARTWFRGLGLRVMSLRWSLGFAYIFGICTIV